MPYYHVYVAYRKNKKIQKLMRYNFNTEEKIQQQIATPYMKNKSFFLAGKVIHPSSIDQIVIFKSYKPAEDYTLPNGNTIINEKDIFYIAECFAMRIDGIFGCSHDFITSAPEGKEELIKTPTKPLGKKENLFELHTNLMDSATFLELDTNWSLATCALQLQEVAVILVAKRKGIKLDKANVEKVLNKKIQRLSFNDQYEAFATHVKALYSVGMPILTTHLRKMRTKVLHEGYNPKPEETESIVSFTIGLLKKLKKIS